MGSLICVVFLVFSTFRSLKFEFWGIKNRVMLPKSFSWLYYNAIVLAVSSACFTTLVDFANAEVSFEVYGGYQTSPHSLVTGEYEANLNGAEMVPFRFNAGWNGKSFSMPPYYGLRFTNWGSQTGWGLDFTHSKAYADADTLKQAGFELLQFTDGLNNFTVHGQTKIGPFHGKSQAYFGYGIGIIVPHVELQVDETLPRTFEYQYGGPTLAINTGFKFPINDQRFFFTEYKFTASWLDVKLNGGGSLETRILTNALNVGLGFEF